MAVYLVRSCARCGAYFGIASDVGIGLRGLWFEGRRRSLVRDACLKSRLIDSSLIEAVNLRTRYAGVVPEVKVKPMSDFAVHFDSEPFESLDQLALLACQDYNLGGEGDWFGEFRGGLYGFYARLYGVQSHYSEVHAWLPRVRTPTETEYHLASIMFQMDSALECFTFALNALGWAVMPSGFCDVTDEKALRSINPLKILGDSTRNPPMPGYAAIFPSFQTLWQSQRHLIGRIRDLHDVSKHRQTILVGGRGRLDPPSGFYESHGIPEDSGLRTLISPAAEIILQPDPKAPSLQRLARPVAQRDLLENFVPSFADFINGSGAAALADAQANVPLKERRFRSGTAPEVRKMSS